MSPESPSESTLRGWGRFFVRIVFGLALAFLALILLSFPVVFGLAQLLMHAVFGVVFFLAENMPRVSLNAATLVPGIAAFLLGLLVVHVLLKPWASRRGRYWSFGSSIALVSWIPVIFVISFLVPGVFLHLKGLFAEPEWLSKNTSSASTVARMSTQNLNSLLLDYALTKGGEAGTFPAALGDLARDPTIRWSLKPEKHMGRPAEFPIYLGNGFDLESDPELPLVISMPFATRDGEQRFVLTIGGDMKKIPADEADAWIARSLAARRALAPPSP